MNTIKRLGAVVLVLAALLLPVGSAQARGLLDGKVVFGEDFTLESGETIDGDLIVLGGSVLVEDGATVNGSVVVVGGQLEQAGTVTLDIVVVGGQLRHSGSAGRDVVVVGGQVALPETARLGGDLIAIGGQIEREVGAVVAGDVIESIPRPGTERPPVQQPDRPTRPTIRGPLSPFVTVWSTTFRALAMAALAMILSLFLGPQMERVGRSIVTQPALAGGIGLLTAMVLPIAVLILVITVLLIPVAVIVILAVLVAWLFGMVAIGEELGHRLAKALGQSWPMVVSAGIGTFLLMFVTGVMESIPCIGALISVALGFVALGGVLLVWLRADRRSVPRSE